MPASLSGGSVAEDVLLTRYGVGAFARTGPVRGHQRTTDSIPGAGNGHRKAECGLSLAELRRIVLPPQSMASVTAYDGNTDVDLQDRSMANSFVTASAPCLAQSHQKWRRKPQRPCASRLPGNAPSAKTRLTVASTSERVKSPPCSGRSGSATAQRAGQGVDATDGGESQSDEDEFGIGNSGMDDIGRVSGGVGAGGDGAANGGHRARRDPNPFVEFEDKEQRLQWERRWLQDDSRHLAARTRGLMHNHRLSELARASCGAKVMETGRSDGLAGESHGAASRSNSPTSRSGELLPRIKSAREKSNGASGGGGTAGQTERRKVVERSELVVTRALAKEMRDSLQRFERVFAGKRGTLLPSDQIRVRPGKRRGAI